MKKLTLGILAHVDAGKTTLSENILYASGAIRRAGRVDNGDTTMDSDALEKQRGITIYVSRADFDVVSRAGQKRSFVLLDTPGHADFSAEMERSLAVLDYAILVISGSEGVQSHTYTLWRLLERYKIPTFIFVNKMDMAGISREGILSQLKTKLGGDFAEMSDKEAVASASEELMEHYFETEEIDLSLAANAVRTRRLFPVCFGSALKGEGIDELMELLGSYTDDANAYAEESVSESDSRTVTAGKTATDGFTARVFKITHDEKHNRLTHMKILSGRLAIRDKIGEDKVTGIRVYSGDTARELQEAEAGEIVSVSGLKNTYPGQGIGCDDTPEPMIQPVMNYKVILPDGVSEAVMMQNLKEIEEESPEYAFGFDEKSHEIHVRVMGRIQLEILKSEVGRRYGTEIDFGAGRIVYKETIAESCIGSGHFEPLRHYAEVHLLMEPLPRGSGIVADSKVSTDELALNWQRLVMTHITERRHRGVLIGAELTDVKITLIAGRAHLKHTEGGDFRQATYRAIRQGLMEAQSVILEPYYDFMIKVPQNNIGRAMTDIEAMQGKCKPPVSEGEFSLLEGYAPVSEIWDYANEVNAYTRGLGNISFSLRGYDVCHNSLEVMSQSSYLADADIYNPSSSVFCSHGSGDIIPWNEVKSMCHIDILHGGNRDEHTSSTPVERKASEWITPDEVDKILKAAGGQNKKNKAPVKKEAVTISAAKPVKAPKPQPVKPKYMLVDGYNIIFAWDELRELAKVNIDSARLRLNDIISNYAGFREIETAVIYDAYRLENHKTEKLQYHNISVVFTATAETADHYIERFTNDNAGRYDIIVATSDGVEQIIIRSQGCTLLSATHLFDEVKFVNQTISEIIHHGSI